MDPTWVMTPRVFRFGYCSEVPPEHAELIAPFLREWWGGSEERSLELIEWFAGLYPERSIGPLEDLYRDIIAVYPAEKLNSKRLDEIFDLGPWMHKSVGLARGAWISG